MPVRFLNPNYHVVLIHYPLGVFVLGVILELLTVFRRRSSLRVASRWMILLGALLSIPAATSGIAALQIVGKQGAYSTERYAFMRWHVIWMGIGTLIAVFCAVVGLGANNRWREKLSLPLLLGCLIAWGCMTCGAWYGGESIYSMGTSVSLVKYRGKGENPKPFIPPAMINKVAEEAAAETPGTPEEKAEAARQAKYNLLAHYYIGGEEQAHIVFSGLALAAALGALGLSIRRLTTLRAHDVMQLESEQQEASLIGGPPRRVTDDVAVMRTLNPEAAMEPRERVPVTRFWALAVILTLFTMALGYWILEKDRFGSSEGYHAFLRVITYPKDHPDEMRHFAHFVLSCGLVLVMFIMGALALWSPRRRLLLTIFSTLLVLLMAAQIWIGILLTFDDEGKLTRFNKPDTDDSSAMIQIQNTTGARL